MPPADAQPPETTGGPGSATASADAVRFGSPRLERRHNLSAELTSFIGRERELAALIARGLTNRQIAEALVITEGTAVNHVRHIMEKLGLHTRARVASWATEHGLRPAPSDSTPGNNSSSRNFRLVE